MPQVKIGPKLFTKEKSMYRDWLTSIARENLQNSVDAGATHIDIKIEDDETLKKVTFSDNGPGMDLNTLETIYFVLGESTKTTSATTIGGYGVARILTCFAQDHYSLRTRDIAVNGCGAEYQIVTGQPFFHGVEVVAWINPEGQNIQQKFENYLSKCHIQARVMLNGVRWTEWTYKNKFERSLSFGNIFTNKSKHSGVFVRVNGVLMFTPHCSAPFNVVVEIDQSKSRQVLQANRDGLLFQYQPELESFVAELNINKQSALREKRSKSTTFEGTGTFISKRTVKKTAEKEVEEFEAVLVANGHSPLDIAVKNALINRPAAWRHEKMLDVLKEVGIEQPVFENVVKHSRGFDIEEVREKLKIELYSVVIHDDTSNQKVRKVIDSYSPANWDLLGEIGSRYDKRYGETRSFRAGVEKYKLLTLWKAACEFCIGLLQNTLQHGSEEINWGVGWIFSDIALAEQKSDGGVRWLLINPCLPDGTMRLSVSAKRDFIKMLSDAAHEVTHIVYSDHDERFANLLNSLLEEVMASLSEAINYMKDAKETAVSQLSVENTNA